MRLGHARRTRCSRRSAWPPQPRALARPSPDSSVENKGSLAVHRVQQRLELTRWNDSTAGAEALAHSPTRPGATGQEAASVVAPGEEAPARRQDAPVRGGEGLEVIPHPSRSAQIALVGALRPSQRAFPSKRRASWKTWSHPIRGRRSCLCRFRLAPAKCQHAGGPSAVGHQSLPSEEQTVSLQKSTRSEIRVSRLDGFKRVSFLSQTARHLWEQYLVFVEWQ